MDFRILECRRFIAPSARSSIKRIVYDYEIDFHLIGDRIITVNDRESIIKKGDISFRRPGQTVYSIGDYDCYILTLDFSRRKDSKKYSRNEAGEIQPECCDSIVAYLPDKITPSVVNEYVKLFEDLSGQVDFESTYSKDIVRHILHLINVDAIKMQSTEQRDTQSAEDTVYKYINENFTNRITLKGLSDHVHLDASYLSRIFKRKFKMSPIEYVISRRLDYARSLVVNTDLSAAQIAECCGYNNVSFFISAYKKEYGYTPYRHRKHIRDN